jgi:hypothetical protein
MLRLFREAPGLFPIVVVGLVALIAYLVARGRRLGPRDLIGFIVMAAIFDGLAILVHGMWRQNDPFNLFVMAALLFIVPVGAFATLGSVVIAVRIAHIGLTGGKPEDAPGRRPPANRAPRPHTFKRVWLPAAAAVVCLGTGVAHRSVLWFMYALVAAGVALIWWWMLQRDS